MSVSDLQVGPTTRRIRPPTHLVSSPINQPRPFTMAAKEDAIVGQIKEALINKKANAWYVCARPEVFSPYGSEIVLPFPFGHMRFSAVTGHTAAACLWLRCHDTACRVHATTKNKPAQTWSPVPRWCFPSFVGLLYRKWQRLCICVPAPSCEAVRGVRADVGCTAQSAPPLPRLLRPQAMPFRPSEGRCNRP